MFSPAAKAGLGVGDTIITINDWNIEAMENIQVRFPWLVIEYLSTSSFDLQISMFPENYSSSVSNYCLYCQAVINIFLAAGFSVSLGWSKPGTAQATKETCHSLDLI